VKLLRSVLYTQAGLWVFSGLSLAIVPRFVVDGVFDNQAIDDCGLIQILGVVAVGMAMLMVLVAQRLDDVWWWSWAFIITTAAVATVAGFHAVFGPLTGRAQLMFWLIAGTNAIIAAGLLVGIGRAAQEKPFA
jgi:hypothetical protein